MPVFAFNKSTAVCTVVSGTWYLIISVVALMGISKYCCSDTEVVYSTALAVIIRTVCTSYEDQAVLISPNSVVGISEGLRWALISKTL